MRGDWRCTAVSMRGASHARSGTPCQDAHAWSRLGDTLVLAVADGAGSASHSDHGSQLAVETALSVMIRGLVTQRWGETLQARRGKAETVARHAARLARNSLFNEARRRQIRPRELATTLLAVIVTPEHTTALQVGDGGIVCTDAAAEDPALFIVPERHEYVNETVFLTDEASLEHIKIRSVAYPVPRLALFTDGIEPVAVGYDSGQPCDGFFNGLFGFMEQAPLEAVRAKAIEDLLQHPRITNRSDDDKTLILAVSHAHRAPERQSATTTGLATEDIEANDVTDCEAH